MSDIFPGVVIPNVDYLDINLAMTEFMTEHNLQPIPIAMTKVLFYHPNGFDDQNSYTQQFAGNSAVRNEKLSSLCDDSR